MNSMMQTRYFALLMGILFVLAGVGGFVPLVTAPMSPDAPALSIEMSYGYLLGLFPINVIHNLVHLSFGIWGLVAYRSYPQARLYCRSLALILAVFAIMGLFAQTYAMFGLMPLFGHDIWLHALEAVVAGYLGYFARSEAQIASA
ncbi:MAG: DUF4383 domain-containing protein [Anaerolineae bacterium]